MIDVGVNSVNNGSVVGSDVGLMTTSFLGSSGIIKDSGGGSPPVDAATWDEILAANYSWIDMDTGGSYEKTWDELV